MLKPVGRLFKGQHYYPRPEKAAGNGGEDASSTTTAGKEDTAVKYTNTIMKRTLLPQIALT